MDFLTDLMGWVARVVAGAVVVFVLVILSEKLTDVLTDLAAKLWWK